MFIKAFKIWILVALILASGTDVEAEVKTEVKAKTKVKDRRPQAVIIHKKSHLYNNPNAPLIIRKTYRPDVADYFEIDQQ